MAYKTIENNFSFADIAIQSIADKNRSLLFLREINKTINWEPVQALLMKFYETGKTKEGERAYSPLLLFKCLLLQKWFQIKSELSLLWGLGINFHPKNNTLLFLVCLGI